MCLKKTCYTKKQNKKKTGKHIKNPQAFTIKFLSRFSRNDLLSTASDNKQLLDEVELDIMNYQNRGLCYQPKPKAEADNTDTRV